MTTEQQDVEWLVEQLGRSQANAAQWNSMYMSICAIHKRRTDRKDALIAELKSRIAELERQAK